MPQLSPTSGATIFLFVFISLLIFFVVIYSLHEKPLSF